MSSNNTGAAGASSSTLSGSTNETRTLSHTGAEVGEDFVDRQQNTTGSLTPILRWTVPKKYKSLVYSGGKHTTKAELRQREDSANHNGTTVSLNANLQPINGETDLDEQQFPVAVVANTTTGNELTVNDVDYVNDELTLATDPGGDDIAIWTVINEGTIKYVAENQFNQQVGPLDPFGVPVHVFADFKQNKNQTMIHLIGSGKFLREERLVAVLDSPRQVVWEDSDYPRDQYASKYTQKVDVSV